MKWLVFALVNIIGSTLNNFFVKLASGKISPLVGAVLVYSGGLVFLLILFPFMGEKLVMTKEAVILSLAAGSVLGLASVAWFKMYEVQAPISTATFIALVGIMLLSALIGVVIFKEKASLRFYIGASLAIAGLYLLITA